MGLTGGLMVASQPVEAGFTPGTNVSDACTYLAASGHCGAHTCSGENAAPNGPRGGGSGCRSYDSGSSNPRGAGSGCRSYDKCSTCRSFSSPRGGKNNQIAEEENNLTVTNPAKLTETDLVNKLNPQGKATYQSLSPEGKALALKLANQACKGQNSCAGEGACKSTEHACLGKNDCKGKGTCSFKDKNDAVRAASLKMVQKRANSGN